MSESSPDLKSADLKFNWIEYSVFSSMLIFSLLIGVYYGWFKKQDTVAEYLLGGKKMGVFPVTMSLIFSHVSGVALLGIPAEIYAYGTQYAAIMFCNLAIYFIVSYLYLPVFYHLQLNSLYEYLELRFSKGTRTLASLIFAISLITYIPMVVYVPALAFNQATGVSVYVIAPIVSLICIFYTSSGGLKAVLWTDTLQSVFTTGSLFFILVLGCVKIGSVYDIVRINYQGGRFELFNMNPDPFERNTFWSVVVGSIFLWMAQLAVHPGAIQRFISVSTFKEAKAVSFWACIGFFIIFCLTESVGLLVYATFHDCDPVAIKVVEKPGQIVPYYVMGVSQEFPGLTGLFISGVLSAALSTMSAGLNTVAGTLYEDFVFFILKGKKQSDATQSCILKVIVIVLGLLCTSLVFVVDRLGAILQMALSLLGVTSGALVGVFSLGIFFPQANAQGAMAGAFSSLVVISVIVFQAQLYVAEGLLKYPGKVTSVLGCPANFTASLGFNASANVQTYTGYGTPVVADDSVPRIFQLSHMHYATAGTLIAVGVGLAVSYITEPADSSTLDPLLYSPFVRRFLPKQPAKAPAEEYVLVKTEQSHDDLKVPEKENLTVG